jgi:hypothetical protein
LHDEVLVKQFKARKVNNKENFGKLKNKAPILPYYVKFFYPLGESEKPRR